MKRNKYPDSIDNHQYDIYDDVGIVIATSMNKDDKSSTSDKDIECDTYINNDLYGSSGFITPKDRMKHSYESKIKSILEKENDTLFKRFISKLKYCLFTLFNKSSSTNRQ